MPISTSLVGRSLGQHETRIESRRMLAYAAGIGELAPPVFDDAAPGFIAVPAMCVAIEWPLLISPANRALITSTAAEAARAVHTVQDSTFHRPVVAGDRLKTRGSVTAVWRSPAGAAVRCELRTVDLDGTPVFSTRLESLYRGVEVDGDDRPPPASTTAPAAAAAQTIEIDVPVPRELAHVYTECAQIWNPIHTEERVAQAFGLRGTILHGTASWALAAREIVARVAGGDHRRLQRHGGRFAAMVTPGTTLTLRLAVSRQPEATHVHFTLLTPEGRPAISEGFAEIANAP